MSHPSSTFGLKKKSEFSAGKCFSKGIEYLRIYVISFLVKETAFRKEAEWVSVGWI